MMSWGLLHNSEWTHFFIGMLFGFFISVASATTADLFTTSRRLPDMIGISSFAICVALTIIFIIREDFSRLVGPVCEQMGRPHSSVQLSNEFGDPDSIRRTNSDYLMAFQERTWSYEGTDGRCIVLVKDNKVMMSEFQTR